MRPDHKNGSDLALIPLGWLGILLPAGIGRMKIHPDDSKINEQLLAHHFFKMVGKKVSLTHAISCANSDRSMVLQIHL